MATANKARITMCVIASLLFKTYILPGFGVRESPKVLQPGDILPTRRGETKHSCAFGDRLS
jgi:hypothetical protein